MSDKVRRVEMVREAVKHAEWLIGQVPALQCEGVLPVPTDTRDESPETQEYDRLVLHLHEAARIYRGLLQRVEGQRPQMTAAERKVAKMLQRVGRYE